MNDYLGAAFPTIARSVPKLTIADLPTPVSVHTVTLPAGSFDLAVKHDEATNSQYGGNKVRKLEYLLQRAQQRNAKRVATFGAVGSNHALATAIHAAGLGLEATVFLSHQKHTPRIPLTLNMHCRVGTEVVTYPNATERTDVFRKYLQGRGTWVIPLGGTCWLGAAGFVNAGFELAQQVIDGEVPKPSRIYMAAGTTGSVAGLVVGLAAAGLDTRVHAIQVADNPFASEEKLHKLIAKTATLLRRIDPRFDTPGCRENVVWRDDFLAGGYARVNEPTSDAVEIAHGKLGLKLETTYTGKALAAMIHDLGSRDYDGGLYLFWNTANAHALPVTAERPGDFSGLPHEFTRYYD